MYSIYFNFVKLADDDTKFDEKAWFENADHEEDTTLNSLFIFILFIYLNYNCNTNGNWIIITKFIIYGTISDTLSTWEIISSFVLLLKIEQELLIDFEYLNTCLVIKI